MKADLREVSVPDTDAANPSKVPRIECFDKNEFTVGGWTNIKGSTIFFRVLFLDESGVPQGTLQLTMTTVSSTPDWAGSDYLGVVSGAEPTFHCVADEVAIVVDSFSWGASPAPKDAKWTISVGFPGKQAQ